MIMALLYAGLLLAWGVWALFPIQGGNDDR